jgi:hypothetical protein
LAPVSADADPAQILMFPITGNSKLADEEIQLLSDLVINALKELPQRDYSAAMGRAPGVDPKALCDAQCLLEAARAGGASYFVAVDVKKMKKGAFVMTATLTAVGDGQILFSLTSEICTDVNGLIAAARPAAASMREKLATLVPAPEPAPIAAPVEPSPPAGPVEPPPGILKITSVPRGARVALFRSKDDPGQPAGSTPLEMPLKPWSYRVHLEMSGYLDHEEMTTVHSGQSTEMSVAMEVDKWPPLRIAAHATLWPGVLFGLFGGLAGYLGWYYSNRYDEALDGGVAQKGRMWTTIMWAAGGTSAALLTTSLVLLLMGKKEAKRTARSTGTMIGAAPTLDGTGGLFALGRGF